MKQYSFADCVEITGSSCRKYEGQKWYVSTGAVNVDHIENLDVEIVCYDEKPSRANLVVEPGNVLFAKMQGTKKALLIDENLAQHIYSTGFCAVRPKLQILTEKCLYHLVASEIFLEQKDKNCSGATQKAITNAGLEKILIRVPEIENQDAISERLDKLVLIKNKRQEELNKLDELIKARFVEMFWDNRLTERWPCKRIADISIDMRTGPFGSALHHNEFVDKGVFVLGIDNAVDNKFSYNRMRYITEEKYQKLKRYTVKSGDVIITIMGTVGRSAVIPEDMPKAINTKHLACITPDKTQVNSYFLSCAFQMHPSICYQLNMQAKGAIMDGLNLTIIKGLSLPLPPINMQEQFMEFYRQTDKLKNIVQKSLDETQLLFDAFMQKYFGKE